MGSPSLARARSKSLVEKNTSLCWIALGWADSHSRKSLRDGILADSRRFRCRYMTQPIERRSMTGKRLLAFTLSALGLGAYGPVVRRADTYLNPLGIYLQSAFLLSTYSLNFAPQRHEAAHVTRSTRPLT